MKMNRENYTRSLENIRPSEKFLAETKKLMLEEAEKGAETAKPSRRTLIMKITPFAAIAACAAIIAAVSVDIINDKGVETAKAENIAVCTETSAEVFEEAAEEDASEADTAEKSAAEEASSEKIAAEKEIAEPAEETEPNEPAFFAADSNAVSDEEDANGTDVSAEADENAYPEAADEAESTEKHHTNFLYDSFDVEDPNADGNETDGNDNAGYEEYVTDDDIEDSGDDTDVNTLLAPAFTKLSGGKAAAYPDFSPTDTEKLSEFLALVSQDDVNAEVTDQSGKSTDVFGEKALALNSAFANAVEKLAPSGERSFEPTFSFSVFDNVSGDDLYTVRTDGENLSVQVKNGETAYFTADKSVIDSIID